METEKIKLEAYGDESNYNSNDHPHEAIGSFKSANGRSYVAINYKKHRWITAFSDKNETLFNQLEVASRIVNNSADWNNEIYVAVNTETIQVGSVIFPAPPVKEKPKPPNPTEYKKIGNYGIF